MLSHMHVQYGSVSACQDGDASQTHRVYNIRRDTHQLPHKSQINDQSILLLSEHKVNSRILQTLKCVTFVLFPDWLFIFCDAKFHLAVHGKPSLTLTLLIKHCGFSFLLIRTPGVFSCSSTCFVCVIWICLTWMNAFRTHWSVIDKLRIHNLEVQSDECTLSSSIGIYLPLPMHSTA